MLTTLKNIHNKKASFEQTDKREEKGKENNLF